MKSVAEFVMRGRWQALLVTVAGAGSLLFCWLSAAVLALVTLRKGAMSGGWLFLWALLPAGTLYYVYGDSGPLLLLAGTNVLALVLRATVNLPLTVLVGVVVGVLTGLFMVAFSGAYLDQMAAALGELLGNLERQLSQGEQVVQIPRPGVGQIAGMIGAGIAMMSVMCLLLARYWQAALYNPGGFGREFRELHYPVAVSLALVLAALVLATFDERLRTWAMICLLPLTFSGLALVHAHAAMRGRGAGWLAGFYVVWLIFDPVKLAVVFIAFADSWFNFRRRWAGGPRASGKQEDSPDEQDHPDA